MARNWHIFLPVTLGGIGPSQVALVLKNPPTNVGDSRDTGSIPGSERSPRDGNGNLLQYCCLGNCMESGVWWATKSMGSHWVRHDWAGIFLGNIYPSQVVKTCVLYLYNLDFKEIQPVHSKWDQSWVFIGGTDAEAETPVLWPSHVKSWLIGKDPDARRDWGQEEKGKTEDEIAGWHHRLDGHEFE